jgi:hypothetical protein
MLLFMAVISKETSAFRRQFQQASEDDKDEKSKRGESNLCCIPISLIAKAFQVSLSSYCGRALCSPSLRLNRSS